MLALILWLGIAHAGPSCTLYATESEVAQFENEDLQALKLLGYRVTADEHELLAGARMILPASACRRALHLFTICEYGVQIGEMRDNTLELSHAYRGSTLWQAILQLPYCREKRD